MGQVDYAALAEQARQVTPPPVDPNQWDRRADGSRKGNGFLGVLQRPDGKGSSEISIGVSIDGKEIEIPTLVPTLTQQEKSWLLTNDVSDPKKIPQTIIDKAIAYARPRIAAGKSPFASSDESPIDYAALAEQARQSTTPPSTNTGLALTAGGKAIPFAAHGAEELATNPGVPKIAASIGRVAGGAAPVVAGAAEGGPVGALVGVAASARGAWAGGKTGWFTGKLLQKVTAPVATVLAKVAPYAQALSTIGTVQNGLDLMQMLEPDRKDIGFLGIAVGDQHLPAGTPPPLINLAVSKLREAFQQLQEHGLSKEDAANLLMQGLQRGIP